MIGCVCAKSIQHDNVGLLVYDAANRARMSVKIPRVSRNGSGWLLRKVRLWRRRGEHVIRRLHLDGRRCILRGHLAALASLSGKTRLLACILLCSVSIWKRINQKSILDVLRYLLPDMARSVYYVERELLRRFSGAVCLNC